MNYKYYAGIGARNTPPEVLLLMNDISSMLYYKGYTIRSGGAKGAE